MSDIILDNESVKNSTPNAQTNPELSRMKLVPNMIHEGITIVRDSGLPDDKKIDKLERVILQPQLGRYAMAELMKGVVATSKAKELTISDMDLLSPILIKTTHEGLNFSFHNQDAFDKSVEFIKKLVVTSTPPADIKKISELKKTLNRLVQFFSSQKS